MDFPSKLNFRPDQGLRIGEDGDTVLAVSGTRTRNKDFWSGKDLRITPAGIRLAAFNANPVLLWMHHMGIPLGNVQMYLQDDKVWAHQFSFHRKEIPLVHEGWASGDIGLFNTAVIADLWEEFFLNAVSISLMMGDEDAPNLVETDEEFIIGSSEALELSIVTIPADRDALRQRMENFGINPQVAQAMTCENGICRLRLYDPGSINLSVPTITKDGKVEILSFSSTSEKTEGVDMDTNENARQDDVQEEVAEFDTTDEVTEEEMVEEEVVEEEAPEEEGVLEEVELEVDMSQVVDAVVANPALIQRLVTLLSANEEFVANLAAAVSQSIEQPRKAKLKFTKIPVVSNGRSTASVATPKRRTESFNQEEAAPAPQRNDGKRLLGLVKPRL
jgi:hypothetical protein